MTVTGESRRDFGVSHTTPTRPDPTHIYNSPPVVDLSFRMRGETKTKSVSAVRETGRLGLEAS